MFKNLLLVLYCFIIPITSAFAGSHEETVQECLSQVLHKDNGCLPDDQSLQALRLVLKSIREGDGSILCREYKEQNFTPPLVWNLPALVYSDGPQRKPWIDKVPEPNDPALYFIDAAARGQGEFRQACGPVFLELYTESDGYFAEFAASVLWLYLSSFEDRAHDFLDYGNYLDRMNIDLALSTPPAQIRQLFNLYARLKDSAFKSAMQNMLRRAQEESERIAVQSEQSTH